MYVKKPVAENVYDSQILITLNTEELTIKQVCDKINSHKPTIRRQIQQDLLKDYLSHKKIDKRGKTTYTIKWNKIVEDFLDYLKKLSKEKEFTKEEYNNLLQKIKPLEKNPYLILILQLMFKEYFKIYIKNKIPLTLEDLFKETILSLGEKLNPNSIKPTFFMKYKNENSFNDFMDFTYFLENYFSSQKIDLDDLFYMELEKNQTPKKIINSIF
jgi:hypothetical protein